MSNNVNVIEVLKEVEALLEGHFLLSSGRHSNRYVQCAKLLQYPDKAEKVLSVIKDKVENLDFDIDRKSTRLNSSHANISYAVFCLKKKKKHYITPVKLLHNSNL